MLVTLWQNSDAASILDTTDGVIEPVSKYQVQELKERGYILKNLATASLYGVQQDGFSYKICSAENGSVIYEGEFPKSNNRNDLYCPEIHITDVTSRGTNIYISLLCHCWCKYDYEFPMFSFQVVKITTRVLSRTKQGELKLKLNNAVLWGYTKKAYTALSVDDYKRAEAETQGDFPSDVAINSEYAKEPIFTLHWRKNKKLTGYSALIFFLDVHKIFGNVVFGEDNNHVELDPYFKCALIEK